MNRKKFLSKIFGGFFAAYLGKELLPIANPIPIAPTDISWQPIALIPPKLNPAIAAIKKEHYIDIMSAPKGKSIDIRYLRKVIDDLKNKKDDSIWN